MWRCPEKLLTFFEELLSPKRRADTRGFVLINGVTSHYQKFDAGMLTFFKGAATVAAA
jgi:hypothetical protein